MIEVLSPVGSLEALSAAVRAGADAVYLGAKSFSARRNATNFDYSELIEGINYAHQYNVKVYLTVNLEVKDSEMPEVIELIKDSDSKKISDYTQIYNIILLNNCKFKNYYYF